MKTLDYIAIGQRIKVLRKRSGLTQEQLAEQCNLSTTYMGHIEQGHRKLSLETAKKISDCLGASLDTIILDKEASNSAIISAIDSYLKNQSYENQQKFKRIIKVIAEHIDEI